LYRLYDEIFIARTLSTLIAGKTSLPVELTLSRAMRSAGGKTRVRKCACGNISYDISVSSTLLFNSFREGEREIVVSGLKCIDRLDALMRIMEHELIHLLELLEYGHSSCSKARFISLAGQMFGHTQVRHELVTQRERVAKDHQLHVGRKVSFTYNGKLLTGVINRISLRATVLVEDEQGISYSDGKRYAKYHVPPHQLKPLPPA